ncbi:oligosaccharide flippase family protein [Micromonospora purpureochromogenes]|uniref:lipopolysaccharide biosynthesis protein n=1 Tax=Micromonospora purpureochromogenes TaxID=47872 RepID=UPI0033E25BC1
MTGIASAALSRGISGVVPLTLVPVTLAYLGTELYGLWMAVVALTGMVAFADLGLGNGLMTKLAPCYSSGDTDRARRYISSAYLALTVVATVLCGTLWLLAPLLPWSSMFNVAAPAMESEARAMALVCLTAFIANVPLSLVIRVQYAYQEVARSNLWQAAGSAAALPLTVCAVRAELPPIAVVAATVVGPLLTNIVNSVWLYGWRRRDLAPSLRMVDRGAASVLLRLSGMFLVLTVVTSIASNADALVVAQALGLEDTTAYAVPARVCTLLGFLVTLLNIPFWSAAGDALARSDIAWVSRLTRRMSLLSVGTVGSAAGVLVLAGEDVLAVLVNGPFHTDHWLMGGLAAWWVLLAAISPRLMVQNAAGVIRPQLVGWLLYLVVSVPMKWYGARHWGLAAVPWAGVTVYLVTVLPTAVYGYRVAMVRSAAADLEDRSGQRRPSPPSGPTLRKLTGRR